MIPSVLETIIVPALALTPTNMDTQAARAMMLAIGLQESRFLHRRQIGGPARGFWQFERGGGVAGVLQHPSTRNIADAIARDRVATVSPAGVYNQLDKDDLLAGVFARLLLWTDAEPLPAARSDSEGTAWAYYMRTWRPGKPHPQTWPKFWAAAVVAVTT